MISGGNYKSCTSNWAQNYYFAFSIGFWEILLIFQFRCDNRMIHLLNLNEKTTCVGHFSVYRCWQKPFLSTWDLNTLLRVYYTFLITTALGISCLINQAIHLSWCSSLHNMALWFTEECKFQEKLLLTPGIESYKRFIS